MSERSRKRESTYVRRVSVHVAEEKERDGWRELERKDLDRWIETARASEREEVSATEEGEVGKLG